VIIGIEPKEGPEAQMRLRPFRHGDENDIADICLRTGDSGADASGMYRSPGLLADIFALPYVARHPDCAFVIERTASSTVNERVVGYVVCAPDTEAFERWFRTEWWPPRRDHHIDAAEDAVKDAVMLRYAAEVGARSVKFTDTYPAHLHIDLLPEAQGMGWGRKLIDALIVELRQRGVPGLQLTAGARNSAAIAFYEHIGLTQLDRDAGGVTFGVDLTGTTAPMPTVQ
jgi:ribosomal protein S18 acetylase RimI-like enzyme